MCQVIWTVLLGGILMFLLKYANSTQLYVANGSTIQELNVSMETKGHVVLNDLSDAIAVDFDPIDKRVYWIDSKERTINRAFSNGTEKNVIVKYDLLDPRGLAVDPLGKNVFFSDRELRKLSVVTQDGRRTKVLCPNLSSPEAIQLDLKSGYMFWLDTDLSEPRIEKANLNCSNRQTIVRLEPGCNYRSLAVSTSLRQIYWTKYKYQDSRISLKVSQIQYISYDGGTVMNISGEQLRSSKPYAVSAHQNILFWSQIESEIGSIYALNLTSSYASKLFNSTYLKPYDLAAALDTSMLPIINSCSGSTCGKEICLPLPGNSQCLCQNGMDFEPCDYNIHDQVFVGFGHSIRQYHIKGGIIDYDFQCQIEARNVTAIAHTNLENRIVWAENNFPAESFLKVGDLSSGSPGKKLLEGLVLSPNSIVVDKQPHLYWLDDVLNIIGVAEINGNFPKILVNGNMTSPGALTIDYTNESLVWAEMSVDLVATINYLNLATLERKVVLRLPNERVLSIAVHEGFPDPPHRLFWLDGRGRKLKSWDWITVRELYAFRDFEFFNSLTLWKDAHNDTECLFLTENDSNILQFCPPNSTFPKTYATLPGARTILSTFYAFPNIPATCVSDSSPSNRVVCNQLCLGMSTCYCTRDFHWEEANSCCKVDLSYIISGGDEALDILKISYIDDNFIYTRLRTIDLNGYRLKSLSVNYWSKEVLWVDTKNHGIYKMTLDLSEPPKALPIPLLLAALSEEEEVGELAVDWKGGNVFWTLSGRIDMMSLKASNSRKVFKSGLPNPCNLAVNSDNGLVFWTSSSSELTIFQCSFEDCYHPQQLEIKGLSSIEKRDYFIKDLYTRDNMLVALLGRYNTTQFKIIRWDISNKPVSEFPALDETGNILAISSWEEYYLLLKVDSQQERYLVHQITRDNAQDIHLQPLPTPHSFFSIGLFSPVTQKAYHVCQYNNGGCSHICIPVGAHGRECQCPIGMILKDNKFTCQNILNGSVIFLATSKSLYLAKNQDTLSANDLQILPFTGENITFVRYDPVEQNLIIVDYQKYIYFLNINDWTYKIVVNLSRNLGDQNLSITDVIYDFYGGNLFYTFGTNFLEGSGYHQLKAARNSSFFEYNSDKYYYSDLAVNPHIGELYWLSTKITDSLHQKPYNKPQNDVEHVTLRRPSGLTCDFGSHGNLYWISHATRELKMYNFTSGRDRVILKDVYRTEYNKRSLLSVAEQHVFWLDELNILHRANKITGSGYTKILEAFQNDSTFVDFLVTLDNYAIGRSKCLENNCEYWCLNEHDLKNPLDVECLCPYNYRLGSEGCMKTECENDEFLCKNGGHCVKRIEKCNGHFDCADGSDEHDCSCAVNNRISCETGEGPPECIKKDEICQRKCDNIQPSYYQCWRGCAEGMFECADQNKCILLDYRCEPGHHRDCDDGSDEINCNGTTAPSAFVTTAINHDVVVVTSLLSSLSVAVVVILLIVFITKHVWYRRNKTYECSSTQNGSVAHLTSTRISMSTAATTSHGNGDVSHSEESYCSLSTKETMVSMATGTDLEHPIRLSSLKELSTSEKSLESIVTADPVTSDPPPSPVTHVVTFVAEPSILTYDHTLSYMGPNPSINPSCFSEFDKISSVSGQLHKTHFVNKPSSSSHNSYIESVLPPNQEDMVSFGSFVSAAQPQAEGGDLVSLGSNSHCTPPPPPSPVTLRSQVDVNDTFSSTASTLV